MARPLRIETTGASSNFKSGDYQYDSAGNIVKIGTDWFLYDARSRLVSSRVDDQPDLPGVDRLQSYTFDRYGNLGSTTTQVGAGTPVTRTSPAVTTTNRLSGGAYDAFGNVTAWSGQTYGWDVLRMMKSSPGRFLIYGPGDERIWEFAYTDPFNAATFVETYALRGLGGQVLREYKLTGGNATGIWSLTEDFIYRDGQLLASATPTTTTHFTLDHLGSPRLATGPTETTVAYHAYYPFGEEATSPSQDLQRMKFTGHQRDYLGGGTTDDLDYMHARYGSPMTGRFLSVDPVLGEPSDPQRWNRYAYVMGNPMRYTDPLGLVIECVTNKGGQEGTDLDCQEEIEVIVEAPSRLEEALDQLIVEGPAGGFGSSKLDLYIAQRFYDSNFNRYAVEGRYGLAYLNYFVDAVFVPNSEAELAMAVIPPARGAKAVGVVAKPVRDLIRGSLKASASYRTELEMKTVAELTTLAQGKGPVARAAKQMLKLVKDAKRLLESKEGKPR